MERGLTLSGTKTHVKQYLPPLTPLLMASDDLLSPVLPAGRNNGRVYLYVRGKVGKGVRYHHYVVFRPVPGQCRNIRSDQRFQTDDGDAFRWVLVFWDYWP
ncbi:hypothetical protein [Photorhabdus heterorhabditis]|uniref:hypothetical protein n=1 Tax=Photorhabdus heterorhabditis TaxID=880156 RepID=UPI0011F31942|nr:hypothetical protein [Photorhabdus heterorhabditis]